MIIGRLVTLFSYNVYSRSMTDPICNLCERKLSDHTYEESIKCAMELIKQGHKKIGMGQHRLRQTMSKDNST